MAKKWVKMIKILEIFNFWDMLNFGQLRCLLELGGFPYLSEFEQTSEMRNSQGTRGTREPPGFLQAAPLRCFFFLPPFYIAGPLSLENGEGAAENGPLGTYTAHPG